MPRNPYADRAALRMLGTSRDVGGGAEQESEPATRSLLHDAKLCVVHARIPADLREITAHERQMMSLVDLAQLADAGGRRCVSDTAPERVGGVGGVGDHAACPHDVRGEPDESRLRMCRMDLETLGHDFKCSRSYNYGLCGGSGYKA